MPLAGSWFEVWIYLGFVFGWTVGARPRFDTSTDMGLVLVPADAEVDSVIFRLRATDQDADFPLVFEITATITPVVRIDNLPCTLYNKVCQANVILTKRLIPGRLHDFAVRVRDTKGDSNSMQATISVTNATTSRDKIFPHIPSLIMVPEDARPGKELDYLLVRANQRSGKPVYIELWQPKELFTIRQRQTPSQTRGVITLIGELDFETQSMYTLTMYATDPYTDPGKDTRNIAGLNVVVIVQDVQDVPPIFTLAPPLTRINNSVQPGDILLRVHAEDGDKGVPRDITYGLVSEGNPFTPFFNISETTGEITLARPLEELTQITHVGAPVVLSVVAEEIRRSTEEPPAQATVVEVGLLLGEPGNNPPYFESDNFVATVDENLEPGTVINFAEQYSNKVRDEDIGKAGVFALKLVNNNGTFEINPTVAERTADFVVTVRDNALIDYELYKSLTFKIVAQEVGPATNLSASASVTIYLRDANDNPPVFDEDSYEVTLSENVTAGTRVAQVHATDKDTGTYGSVRYTRITGEGSEAFTLDPDTGLVTVSMGSSLDRELAARLRLTVEARDENGDGNRGAVPLTVNLLDVNDNAPIFERTDYEFALNADMTNFTTHAVIKAVDADAEPPNNVVRYELIHGNYENKFHLDQVTGELFLRSPIGKVRRKKQSVYGALLTESRKDNRVSIMKPPVDPNATRSIESTQQVEKSIIGRTRRASEDGALFTLTARAYDLGVPHLSSVARIRVTRAAGAEARTVMFVVPGEHPDPAKTARTLATITGGRVTVQEIRPYVSQNDTGAGGGDFGLEKRSIVVALVEQNGPGASLVDIEKIRQALAANGVGIIGGTDTITDMTTNVGGTKSPVDGYTQINEGQSTRVNATIIGVHTEEEILYKAENKLLFWLLIILGILVLLAIAALIVCCICPGCPFYMAPRKRRVHSSETLVVRSDGRPKRHLRRKPAAVLDASWTQRKQAWSADPTRRNWQFNRRNTKNYGLASLPGDVAYIGSRLNDAPANVESLRLRDGPSAYDHARRSRMDEQERMYMEDVEAQKVAAYDGAEEESLRRHEADRGSDVARQSYRYAEQEANGEPAVREQHFYREGNAEVLRLVTRGQAEDNATIRHHHPTTLIIDGKEILLRRFMEDEQIRHELSMQDVEAARSMESHQRPKDLTQQQQQGIILIPERLELGHRQQVDELGPAVQRVVVERVDYDESKMECKGSQARQTQTRRETVMAAGGVSGATERQSVAIKDQAQTASLQTYSFRDVELARQNALLARILLEREPRAVAGAMMDSASYLETQSLPGQVAIATQTDRTTATQTDRHARSRSDNDESEDDAKQRRKLKSKKRYEGDSKRTRTLWMKSPIEEEASPCFDKRLSILRKKVKEVKEGRKVCLEPQVLREISDSLDGNGSSCKGEEEEEEETRTYERRTEETSVRYKVLDEQDDGSPGSPELKKEKRGREPSSRDESREPVADDRRKVVAESTSSGDAKRTNEEVAETEAEQRSPRKERKVRGGEKKFDIVKPSFRILEREISMLTKKLGKLGDKKRSESTTSDSAARDMSASSKKEFRREVSRKADESSSRSSKPSAEQTPATIKTDWTQAAGQRKETVATRARQKVKHQQPQIFSTGSSEFEEAADKARKHVSASTQDSSKQRPVVGVHGHGKLKRQTQVERRESKRSGQQHDEDAAKTKEVPSRDARIETRVEKVGKLLARGQKLAGIGRRDHASEEFSTSTGSERAEGKLPSTRRDLDKKSSTASSENASGRSSQRRTKKTRDSEPAKDQQRKGETLRETVGQIDEERGSVKEEKKERGEEVTIDGVEPVIVKTVVKREPVGDASVEEIQPTSMKEAVREFLVHEGLEFLPANESRGASVQIESVTTDTLDDHRSAEQGNGDLTRFDADGSQSRREIAGEKVQIVDCVRKSDEERPESESVLRESDAEKKPETIAKDSAEEATAGSQISSAIKSPEQKIVEPAKSPDLVGPKTVRTSDEQSVSSNTKDGEKSIPSPSKEATVATIASPIVRPAHEEIPPDVKSPSENRAAVKSPAEIIPSAVGSPDEKTTSIEKSPRDSSPPAVESPDQKILSATRSEDQSVASALKSSDESSPPIADSTGPARSSVINGAERSALSASESTDRDVQPTVDESLAECAAPSDKTPDKSAPSETAVVESTDKTTTIPESQDEAAPLAAQSAELLVPLSITNEEQGSELAESSEQKSPPVPGSPEQIIPSDEKIINQPALPSGEREDRTADVTRETSDRVDPSVSKDTDRMPTLPLQSSDINFPQNLKEEDEATSTTIKSPDESETTPNAATFSETVEPIMETEDKKYAEAKESSEQREVSTIDSSHKDEAATRTSPASFVVLSRPVVSDEEEPAPSIFTEREAGKPVVETKLPEQSIDLKEPPPQQTQREMITREDSKGTSGDEQKTQEAVGDVEKPERTIDKGPSEDEDQSSSAAFKEPDGFRKAESPRASPIALPVVRQSTHRDGDRDEDPSPPKAPTPIESRHLLADDKLIGSRESDKSSGDEGKFTREGDKRDESASGQLEKGGHPDKGRSGAASEQGEGERGSDKGSDAQGRFAEGRDKAGEPVRAERFADVSLPIFTSVTDTPDDSDDSDSSSDVSRKTAFNTRPYETPRHRARSSPRDPRAEADVDAGATDDEAGLTVEMEEEEVSIVPTNERADRAESVSRAENLDDATSESRSRKEDAPEASASTHFLPPATVEEKVETSERRLVEREKARKVDEKARKVDEKLEEGVEKKSRATGTDKEASTPVTHRSTAKAEFSRRKTERKQQREVGQASSRTDKTSLSTSQGEPEGKPVAETRRARRRSYKPAESDQERPKDADRSRESKRMPEDRRRRQSQPTGRPRRERDRKSSSPPKTGGEVDVSRAQSKYMEWYTQGREAMERRRAEARGAEEEEEEEGQRPRWLRRGARTRRADERTPEVTPRTGRRVKPLVNVESEQLKAIVRQGRKLRKAEGGQCEDPPVQIFATTPPARPPPEARHPLLQHSEYKFEKVPEPFYLHPPPAPHPSPEHYPSQSVQEARPGEFDPGIAVNVPGAGRLRHQQLLEKKSVFDIAYDEAVPSHLRSDSTTPPS